MDYAVALSVASEKAFQDGLDAFHQGGDPT